MAFINLKSLLTIWMLLISSLAVGENYPERYEFKEWIIENKERLDALDALMVQDSRFDYIWNIVPVRFKKKSDTSQELEISNKSDYLKLLPKNANEFYSSDEKAFIVENGFSSKCGDKACIVSAIKFRSGSPEPMCALSNAPSTGVCYLDLLPGWHLRYLVLDAGRQ